MEDLGCAWVIRWMCVIASLTVNQNGSLSDQVWKGLYIYIYICSKRYWLFIVDSPTTTAYTLAVLGFLCAFVVRSLDVHVSSVSSQQFNYAGEGSATDGHPRLVPVVGSSNDPKKEPMIQNYGGNPPQVEVRPTSVVSVCPIPSFTMSPTERISFLFSPVMWSGWGSFASVQPLCLSTHPATLHVLNPIGCMWTLISVFYPLYQQVKQ